MTLLSVFCDFIVCERIHDTAKLHSVHAVHSCIIECNCISCVEFNPSRFLAYLHGISGLQHFPSISVSMYLFWLLLKHKLFLIAALLTTSYGIAWKQRTPCLIQCSTHCREYFIFLFVLLCTLSLPSLLVGMFFCFSLSVGYKNKNQTKVMFQTIIHSVRIQTH
jgi:hypothetical protein